MIVQKGNVSSVLAVSLLTCCEALLAINDLRMELDCASSLVGNEGQY